PEVATASVIVREDRPGDQRLVAYMVLEPGMDAPENLRKHVSGHLPEYMLPSAYMVIDELPLTPNGKVDRKALPVPDHAKSEGRQPRDDRERQLAQLFAEV